MFRIKVAMLLNLWPSSLHSQHKSPLLRLLAELRNKIYKYALGGREILYWSRSKELGAGFSVFPCFFDAPNSPGLFELLAPLHLVCHQTRRETSGMPYAFQHFCVV